MASASKEHARICMNLSVAIGRLMKTRGCEAFASNVRLRTPLSSSYVYPDLMIVCGEPRWEDGEFDTLLNPTVIIEILSPSTESFDRGEKFRRYREIGSLETYAMVSVDRRAIDVFERAENGWVLRPESSTKLCLQAVGISVPLDEVYERVIPDSA